MYEGFSGQARKAMQLAHDEARRLRHEYVGTEHLLVGVLREEFQGAFRLLLDCGVNPARLVREAEECVRPGPSAVDAGQLPLTPRAVKVLEYAREEAAGLKHPSIGVEHLVLGLLRETEGVAGQLLAAHGLTAERLRQELARLPAPDNRDWLLRTEPTPGLAPPGDPSPRDIEALVTEDVLALPRRQRTSAGKTRRPRQRPEQKDDDEDKRALRRRIHRGSAEFDLPVVERQLRVMQFLVAAVLGALAGGNHWGVGGALAGVVAGCAVAWVRSHGLGAVAGFVAGWMAMMGPGVETATDALVGGVVGMVFGACLGDWRQLPAPPGSGASRPAGDPAEASDPGRRSV
jgi:hypothetical protein